ncbi:MAG TPA: GNAT family N-acetyltransferase [Acidimicrobiales bacterium]|nr:GNAT family N-acetyltransferase [Acidimicrobiales bacterium]
MIVRPRNESDLDSCERIARLVHELDGYPALLTDGLRAFVEGSGFYAAWVAEVDGQVVGQVLLRPRSSSTVMEMVRQATGLADDRFGVIARLFVSPAVRRRGIGRALLTTATTAAVSRGLVPVLDVVTKNTAAMALYESMGWARVGTAVVQFHDGPVLDEVVYIGPLAPPPGPPLCA